MSKQQVAIAFLHDQLSSIVDERKKLDAEEQAIRLLLARHEGTQQIELLPKAFVSRAVHGSSVSSLVVKAIKEAGKPQKTEQLLAFLASHGKTTSSATLRSTIYMNKGKLFNVISPGLYDLVEGIV